MLNPSPRTANPPPPPTGPTLYATASKKPKTTPFPAIIVGAPGAAVAVDILASWEGLSWQLDAACIIGAQVAARYKTTTTEAAEVP